MKSTGISKVLLVSLLLTGLGCAQTIPRTVNPTVTLSRAEIDVIMYRRDQGDGLAEIALALRSTRPEVRLAERLEKARLRGEVRR